VAAVARRYVCARDAELILLRDPGGVGVDRRLSVATHSTCRRDHSDLLELRLAGADRRPNRAYRQTQAPRGALEAVAMHCRRHDHLPLDLVEVCDEVCRARHPVAKLDDLVRLRA
jgi:hypothetical protein